MVEKREQLRSIFNAAIRSVEPAAAIRSVLNRKGNDLICQGEGKDLRLALDQFKHIYVVGCGKAVSPMLSAVEAILSDRISKGIVTTKYGHIGTPPLSNTVIVEAGHPLPDRNGQVSCRQMLDLLEEAGENDLVIALISGGGSALWPQQVKTISFEDKCAVNDALIRCGADIHEINCVRTHLSRVKGGQAAKIAAPARVIVLVISDVIGDDLGVIASGPFAPDGTTYSEALDIIRRYRISSLLPDPVMDHLEHGAMGKISETPKGDEDFFKQVSHFLCATNRIAVNAAASEAKSLGYQPIVFPKPLSGEARDAADRFVSKILKHRKNGASAVALIAGGETTVSLPNHHGKGGRNQEFVLSAAIKLSGIRKVIVGSCGTDGNDGPTDAAGAIADGRTIERAVSAGLDPDVYLETHDAYHFFEQLGDLIVTGPTNTNVMDVQCALIG